MDLELQATSQLLSFEIKVLSVCGLSSVYLLNKCNQFYKKWNIKTNYATRQCLRVEFSKKNTSNLQLHLIE